MIPFKQKCSKCGNEYNIDSINDRRCPPLCDECSLENESVDCSAPYSSEVYRAIVSDKISENDYYYMILDAIESAYEEGYKEGREWSTNPESFYD